MMKRLLVVLVVLLPLCWLTAGCNQATTPDAKKGTELPSKEEMDKMLDGQRQMAEAQKKEAKEAAGKK